MARKRLNKAPTAQRTPGAPVEAPEPPNAPTREARQHHDYRDIAAPRGTGEELGRDALARTRRRVCPVTRMVANGWLDRAGAAAVENYARHIEAAEYDTGSRSCLAVSGGSSGAGGSTFYDGNAQARERLAGAAAAIGRVDPVALGFLNAVLAPSNTETVGEIARQMLRGRLAEARERVRIAAAVLGQYFQRH